MLDRGNDGLVIEIDDPGVPPSSDLPQKGRFSRSTGSLKQYGGFLAEELIENRKRVAADVASDGWVHAMSLSSASWAVD